MITKNRLLGEILRNLNKNKDCLLQAELLAVVIGTLATGIEVDDIARVSLIGILYYLDLPNCQEWHGVLKAFLGETFEHGNETMKDQVTEFWAWYPSFLPDSHKEQED